MRYKRGIIKLLSATFLLVGVAAMATPPITTLQSLGNTVALNRVQPIDIKSRAKQWGLTVAEFKRYQWLMQHTASGRWYKKLDPAEVLALNANNRHEMTHYTKIQARLMHERVTRELAFNTLYSVVYRQLYPHEKPVLSPNDTHLSQATLQSGDRVWLFVGVNTPLGRFVYQHIIKTILASPKTMLDIYFIGKNVSTKNIQQWARNVGVPPQLVGQRITLNIGQARFQLVTHGRHVNVPYVGIVHQQRFTPVTLSSVL